MDLQAIHRVRDRLVARRTSVINQLRAFLLERGMTFAKTPFKLKVAIPDILENAEANLTRISAMATGKFILYLRVSTARQCASGLVLEAQREAVLRYLNGGKWQLVQEVVEVESGKRNDRPAIAEALRLCRLSATVRQQSAAKRRDDLPPVIEDLRSKGAMSLRAIAEGLNRAGLTTARGGRWTGTQVMRVTNG